MSAGRPVRRPTSVTVDWHVLLAFNPPPGYVRPSQTSRLTHNSSEDHDTDGNTETDDKVVAILQKILTDLEGDIENERRILKVKYDELFIKMLSGIFNKT